MLERSRFKDAAINDRLTLRVFVDAVADGLFRFFRMRLLKRPAFARLREVTLDFDPILVRA